MNIQNPLDQMQSLLYQIKEHNENKQNETQEHYNSVSNELQ